jgi:hypothetical protein
MEIRTSSLDPNLTVVEIGRGTEDAWHFLPFEERRADLYALDQRYVLAIGGLGDRGTSLAIFDTAERRRTNFESNDQLFAYTRRGISSWCYAPAHRSVFIVEAARKPDGKYPNPFQYLRQLSVDGRVNRRFQIAPDFSSSILLPRDDGRIVCVGLNQVAVVDPASGDSQLSRTDLIHYRPSPMDQTLRWFSPDGRWGLRIQPPLILSPAEAQRARRFGSSLSRMVPRPEAVPGDKGEEHPDLPSDGMRRFGRTLDLFQLDPLRFERRLIVRYDPVDGETLTILERLCDEREPETWNARDQWLSSLSQYAPERGVAKWLYDWIDHVRWDDHRGGFNVAWEHQVREVPSPLYGGRLPERVADLAVRHVSFDGAVGPVEIIPGEAKALPPRPSEAAMKSIRAMVRERSRQIVECASWTGPDVAAALREVRRRIEEQGLETLVFGSQLQLQFRVNGRTIGERKFFETVRGMAVDDVAALLPELRHLLRSYGRAARTFVAARFDPIASGPSDHSPAALSEAALALAMLDDTGFDALRDWVVTVDQEHDPFAAARVFPAMARRTGFATAEAVRFGLWFFLQQWQTVRYEKTYFGLFKAAPAVMTPAAFASIVLAEAQDVASFSSATDVETGVSSVKDMLGRTFWDRAVSTELDRLLDAIRDQNIAG